MAANINSTLLGNFIRRMDLDNLTRLEANGLGIEHDAFNEADVDENTYLSVNEILDSELYEFFATMYVNEQKENRATDEEKAKEEREKVQDKNHAGV